MNDHELEAALKQCSLHSLLILTSRALSHSGFGYVQLLDRRQSKQKSRFGGHELLCETTVGGLPVRVIVKVIQDSVRLRMLDELAGGIRRTNADLGLIVSPHNLTANASQALGSYAPMRIEAITGRTFAELLSRYHIGVRSRGDVDYAFFSELEDLGERLISFLKANSL